MFEIAELKEEDKNHSKDFWQLLDIVSGNAKKLDREVKEYRIQIY